MGVLGAQSMSQVMLRALGPGHPSLLVMLKQLQSLSSDPSAIRWSVETTNSMTMILGHKNMTTTAPLR